MAGPVHQVLGNALSHYYDDIRRAAKTVDAERPAAGGNFAPSFDLPPLTPELRRYLAASELAVTRLGEYGGVDLTLLDLMRNPRTRTTKTLASLLMVARAVQHIRDTGEPVMILTPSSANKATALRDAVLRAVECGLATPDELRITVAAPAASRAKLWSSALSADEELLVRNPVLTHDGPDRSAVKTLAGAVARDHGDILFELTGMRLWYSLDIDNYRVADAARAFFEHEHAPLAPGRTRVHAHAVSSAYGLLGHHLGHTLLDTETPEPRYFLVQHMDTADMVLDLHFGSTDRRNLPSYTFDPGSGLHRQHTDPRFPTTTYDPVEVLDPTFYTRNPPTSAIMSPLIREHGGGGVVVSLHECLSRYGQIRELLAAADIALPADPRRLREWSLVMGLTGVLNGIDRGLVTEDEVLLHGSGCYTTDDFEPVPERVLTPVRNVCDVRKAVFHAALVDSCAEHTGDTSS